MSSSVGLLDFFVLEASEYLERLDGIVAAAGDGAPDFDAITGYARRLRGIDAAQNREVELRDGDIGGIAVHLAARVMAAAGPNEILTSGTVRDLVIGSNVTVEDRGPHALKGMEHTWELFAITRA